MRYLCILFSVIILQSYMLITSDDFCLDEKTRGMVLKATLNLVCRHEDSSLFKGYEDLIMYLHERVYAIEGQTVEVLSATYSVHPGKATFIKKKSTGLSISPTATGFRKVYDNLMQPIHAQRKQKMIDKQKGEYNQSINLVTKILMSKYGYQRQDILNTDRLTPSVEREI